MAAGLWMEEVNAQKWLDGSVECCWEWKSFLGIGWSSLLRLCQCNLPLAGYRSGGRAWRGSAGAWWSSVIPSWFREAVSLARWGQHGLSCHSAGSSL